MNKISIQDVADAYYSANQGTAAYNRFYQDTIQKRQKWLRAREKWSKFEEIALELIEINRIEEEKLEYLSKSL